MIIRIFIALLALNMVAFVVRAEASEHDVYLNGSQHEDLYELQEEMSGDFGHGDSVDAISAIGSRLLSLRLSRSYRDERFHASDAARPDHGIALLEQGACLNLKWNF